MGEGGGLTLTLGKEQGDLCCRPAIPKVHHSEGRVRDRVRVMVISLAEAFGMVARRNGGWYPNWSG